LNVVALAVAKHTSSSIFDKKRVRCVQSPLIFMRHTRK
jgi:hypothetical protein